MDPVALSTALLRSQLPDVTLRPGMTVAARVAELTGRRGVIALAGTMLEAKLPDGVRVGDRLRLVVDEVSPERITLRLADPQAAPVVVAIPLPGGASARISVAEREPSRAQTPRPGPAVELIYDSPRLGDLGLRVELAGERLAATVRAARPNALELAQADAAVLRTALEAATGREVHVSVAPWPGRFEAYA